ncbi:hypothetical protein [Limnospira indica]|uniref:hypothetical protein n=1 Tax=Limnospira indica TaxID=147322 RepID=UPI00024810FC|nr:hypothetical protein [Limnospira indica]QNH58248.1 MAG: hypothetical protein H2674_02345 [Limnospira indica BM01]
MPICIFTEISGVVCGVCFRKFTEDKPGLSGIGKMLKWLDLSWYNFFAEREVLHIK